MVQCDPSAEELSPRQGGLQRSQGKCRCGWCGSDPAYVAYHDNEWGVPCHDERRFFEMLVLECFQTGLSWLTILKKRENFRRAFCNWQVLEVAVFDDEAQRRLLADPGIIRHAGKIAAAVRNAGAFLRVQKEFSGFGNYLWGFSDGKPVLARPRRTNWRQVPASSELSVRVSKDLKKRGFSFCGPVVIYSYLQAVGIVDDHITGCWRAVRSRS